MSWVDEVNKGFIFKSKVFCFVFAENNYEICDSMLQTGIEQDEIIDWGCLLMGWPDNELACWSIVHKLYHNRL